MFFTHFSTEENKTHNEKTIMNQGDILNYMNIHSGINVSKYDIKDIFTKNKFEYKSYRIKSKIKMGILLFKEAVFVKNEDEMPF